MYPALVSLLLGSFAIGTTEFVVAGLLPEIAADLGVTVPQAGFLVTGYALSVAVGGPVLAVGAARLPRKPALLAVMAVFFLGHLVSAAAPDFRTLMLGRAVAAAAHGCYFGLAILLARSIAPGREGMALAIVVGGINIANIAGVPAGTAIGAAFGWRAAFVLVAAIALVAGVAIAVFAPNPPRGSGAAHRLDAQLRALADPRVGTSYALIILNMIAFWSPFTFVAPYFTDAGRLDPALLPVVLLVVGIAGALGIVAAGGWADRFPVLCVIVPFPVGAAGLALAWALTPIAWPAGVAALSAMVAAGSVAAVAVQNRILAGAAAAPELASSLVSAVFNLGIAAGAAIGAQALARGLPVAHLPAIGAGVLVAGSVVAVVVTRGEGRG